mgnify:CR=1 FL=1
MLRLFFIKSMKILDAINLEKSLLLILNDDNHEELSLELLYIIKINKKNISELTDIFFEKQNFLIKKFFKTESDFNNKELMEKYQDEYDKLLNDDINVQINLLPLNDKNVDNIKNIIKDNQLILDGMKPIIK